MRFSVTRTSLASIFTSAFILLVFMSPIVRLSLGFVPYMVVLGTIASFVIVKILNNYYRGYATFFLVLLLVLMSINAALSNHGNLEALFYANTSLVSLLLAYWLAKQDKVKVSTISFNALALFYLLFIYFGIKHGFQPNDVNNYFPEASRNIVSTVALFFQLLYSASYYRATKKLPRVTPVITLVIAFIAYGRSGIALSALLVVVTFASAIWQSKALYKIAFIFVMLALTVVALQYYEAIEYTLLTKTNFSSGLDTPRTIMIHDYLASLDFFRFISGNDLSTIPIINQYNNNPHNSVIYGHSQYGVFYILLLLSLAFIIGKHASLKESTIIYTAFLFIFFLRILADIISLPGVFDYIFFYIVYIIYFDHKEQGLEINQYQALKDSP